MQLDLSRPVDQRDPTATDKHQEASPAKQQASTTQPHHGAYLVALGVYTAVLPTLTEAQVEARLRSAVDGRRVADAHAWLDLLARRSTPPGPSLVALQQRAADMLLG